MLLPRHFGCHDILAGLMSLPTELEEAIITYLAGSKHDLRVCSLVCKRWLPKSRSLLFHSISICPPPPNSTRVSRESNEPFMSSIHYVQSSPHLNPLLKRFKVDCCHLTELTRITFNTLRIDSLSRLWLCRNDFAHFDLDISLTRTLYPSLNTLIIERTVFKDACQLLHFLSSPCFSKLRSLSLTDISYLLRSEGSRRDAEWILDYWANTTSLLLPISSRITLEELEVGLIPDHNIFDILYHSSSPFDWTRLQRLNFFRIYDNGLIQGFLNGPLPSLNCVEFENTEQRYHFASSGPFSGTIENHSVLPKLAQLSIDFHFTPTDLLFLDNILKEAHEISKLRNLIIVLPVDLGFTWARTSTEMIHAFAPKQIGQASDIFAKLASLPSLQKLQLILPLSATLRERDESALKDFCRFGFGCLEHLKICMVDRRVGDLREPFSGANSDD